MNTVDERRRAAVRVLASDQELLYLALLAADGVKPLSRYERPLTPGQCEALSEHGLLFAETVRPTAWGYVARHVVFSRELERLGAYLVEFQNEPLRFDAEGVLCEGLHLGYPECCVRHFIDHGYVPNGLAPADQAILFHWACPHCAATARLLPRYRAVWQRLQEPDCRPDRAPRRYAPEVF